MYRDAPGKTFSFEEKDEWMPKRPAIVFITTERSHSPDCFAKGSTCACWPDRDNSSCGSLGASRSSCLSTNFRKHCPLKPANIHFTHEDSLADKVLKAPHRCYDLFSSLMFFLAKNLHPPGWLVWLKDIQQQSHCNVAWVRTTSNVKVESCRSSTILSFPKNFITFESHHFFWSYLGHKGFEERWRSLRGFAWVRHVFLSSLGSEGVLWEWFAKENVAYGTLSRSQTEVKHCHELCAEFFFTKVFCFTCGCKTGKQPFASSMDAEGQGSFGMLSPAQSDELYGSGTLSESRLMIHLNSFIYGSPVLHPLGVYSNFEL